MIDYQPTKFIVTGLKDKSQEVYIETRSKDHNLWAIISGTCCLNRDGEWEYEPRPSSRTDEFIARTRFSLEECHSIILKFLEAD